jgi:hypothetical protein
MYYLLFFFLKKYTENIFVHTPGSYLAQQASTRGFHTSVTAGDLRNLHDHTYVGQQRDLKNYYSSWKKHKNLFYVHKK